MAKQQTTKNDRQTTKSTGIIIPKIIAEFKDRNRTEIRKWKQAVDAALDINAPKTAMLQDLYDNLAADGHLLSQKELRKAATTCSDFSIKDKKSGKNKPDQTDLFKMEWFYNLMNDILESVFYGYSLIELCDPQTMEFNLIPRRNTIGTKGLVLFEGYGDKGISIYGMEETLIRVGKPSNLGIIKDLCPMLIWKRNAQQSWAEFTERFGMPLISATTNKTDPATIKQVQTMLNALGEAATAVLPEGTTIRIDPFTGGDSYKVYDAQIERINGEMSKPITGGTMISDNGSSRSQSEVHERNLDGKLAISDRRMVEFIVNGQLLHIMQAWGWDVNPQTDRFSFDAAFELSLKDHFDIVDRASNRYYIPEEWISKTFNIPITGVKEVVGLDMGAANGDKSAVAILDRRTGIITSQIIEKRADVGAEAGTDVGVDFH